MKAVGVKNLKARLSEYLRMVKAGETILVTERDTVIAELRPTRRQDRPPDTLEEALQAMAERGEVTLRSKPPGTWLIDPRPKVEGLPSSQELLDEIRKDTW